MEIWLSGLQTAQSEHRHPYVHLSTNVCLLGRPSVHLSIHLCIPPTFLFAQQIPYFAVCDAHPCLALPMYNVHPYFPS